MAVEVPDLEHHLEHLACPEHPYRLAGVIGPEEAIPGIEVLLQGRGARVRVRMVSCVVMSSIMG